jgi:hypothetical protein
VILVDILWPETRLSLCEINLNDTNLHLKNADVEVTLFT